MLCTISPCFHAMNRQNMEQATSAYGYPGPSLFQLGSCRKTLWWCNRFNRMYWIWFRRYEDNPNTVSAEHLRSNFFYQIGNNGVDKPCTRLTAMRFRSIITENAIDQIAAFCITNWALFGDPSLRLADIPHNRGISLFFFFFTKFFKKV